MYVDNPFNSPAVLSFCPGILGLERGLESVIGKIRVMAYVEIEAFIIANLVAGMEAGVLDSAPIWTDAKTFDAHPFRGRIHGLIGGYPCPGESLAGLREGHLYKGFLWPAIRKAISATQPIWCFFENVEGHLTGTYPIVQRSLRTMGYRVEAGIYSALETGAPQTRERLFILALANSYVTGLRGVSEERFQFKVKPTSKKLGNNRFTGLETPRQIDRQKAIVEVEQTNNSKEELANDNIQRGQLQNKREQSTITKPVSVSAQRNFTKWPAHQGPDQYEWEEPRTTKPGLGCTINGYNFRNDLIRALGNSVVEQTAAIAFQDLIQKHLSKWPTQL